MIDRRTFLRRAGWLMAAFHGWPIASRSTVPRHVGPVDVAAPLQIRRLELATRRVEGLLPFYESVLGLPVSSREQGRATVRIGASVLTFREVGDGSEPYYHIAFNIPENKLNRAIRWARDRFEPLIDPGGGTAVVHFRHWNAHSIFFLDDAGNLLELIARHELDNADDGEFGPADFLNISEIGIVVDNVVATVALLEKRLGIGYYAQPPNDRFCAVGDANGLFIVVPPGRRGRFTHAWPGFQESFPTEIVLAGPRPGKTEITDYPYTIHVAG